MNIIVFLTHLVIAVLSEQYIENARRHFVKSIKYIGRNV